jgi:hypothetical protein
LKGSWWSSKKDDKDIRMLFSPSRLSQKAGREQAPPEDLECGGKAQRNRFMLFGVPPSGGALIIRPPEGGTPKLKAPSPLRSARRIPKLLSRD